MGTFSCSTLTITAAMCCTLNVGMLPLLVAVGVWVMMRVHLLMMVAWTMRTMSRVRSPSRQSCSLRSSCTCRSGTMRRTSSVYGWKVMGHAHAHDCVWEQKRLGKDGLMQGPPSLVCLARGVIRRLLLLLLHLAVLGATQRCVGSTASARGRAARSLMTLRREQAQLIEEAETPVHYCEML